MGFFDNSITDTFQSYNELSKVIKYNINEVSNSFQENTRDIKKLTQNNINDLNIKLTNGILQPYGELAKTLNFYIEIISILIIILLILSILCKIKQLFGYSTNNNDNNKKDK